MSIVDGGEVAAWLLWIEFAVSLALGAGVGYFLAEYDTIGFILLGAWFGATTTVLFQNIFLRAVVSGLLVLKMWFTARNEGIALGASLFLIPIVFTYIAVNVVILKL